LQVDDAPPQRRLGQVTGWPVEKLGFVSPSRARDNFTLRVAA
jgi:hypothetical protein